MSSFCFVKIAYADSTSSETDGTEGTGKKQPEGKTTLGSKAAGSSTKTDPTASPRPWSAATIKSIVDVPVYTAVALASFLAGGVWPGANAAATQKLVAAMSNLGYHYGAAPLKKVSLQKATYLEDQAVNAKEELLAQEQREESNLCTATPAELAALAGLENKVLAAMSQARALNLLIAEKAAKAHAMQVTAPLDIRVNVFASWLAGYQNASNVEDSYDADPDLARARSIFDALESPVSGGAKGPIYAGSIVKNTGGSCDESPVFTSADFHLIKHEAFIAGAKHAQEPALKSATINELISRLKTMAPSAWREAAVAGSKLLKGPVSALKR